MGHFAEWVLIKMGIPEKDIPSEMMKSTLTADASLRTDGAEVSSNVVEATALDTRRGGVIDTTHLTVRRMSGAVAFGPEDVRSSLTIAALKKCFDADVPKKLTFDKRVLADEECIATLTKGGVLDLVVLMQSAP